MTNRQNKRLVALSLVDEYGAKNVIELSQADRIKIRNVEFEAVLQFLDGTGGVEVYQEDGMVVVHFIPIYPYCFEIVDGKYLDVYPYDDESDEDEPGGICIAEIVRGKIKFRHSPMIIHYINRPEFIGVLKDFVKLAVES